MPLISLFLFYFLPPFFLSTAEPTSPSPTPSPPPLLLQNHAAPTTFWTAVGTTRPSRSVHPSLLAFCTRLQGSLCLVRLFPPIVAASRRVTAENTKLPLPPLCRRRPPPAGESHHLQVFFFHCGSEIHLFKSRWTTVIDQTILEVLIISGMLFLTAQLRNNGDANGLHQHKNNGDANGLHQHRLKDNKNVDMSKAISVMT